MAGARFAVRPDGRSLIALCDDCEGEVQCFKTSRERRPSSTVTLTLPESAVVPAGETVVLAAVVGGVEDGRLSTLEVTVAPGLAAAGLVSVGEMRLNPTLDRAPLVLMNPTGEDVRLRAGQEVAREATDECEEGEEHVILKVGVEPDPVKARDFVR